MEKDEIFAEYLDELQGQLSEVSACLTGDRPRGWLLNEVNGLERIGLERLIKWLDEFHEGGV